MHCLKLYPVNKQLSAEEWRRDYLFDFAIASVFLSLKQASRNAEKKCIVLLGIVCKPQARKIFVRLSFILRPLWWTFKTEKGSLFSVKTTKFENQINSAFILLTSYRRWSWMSLNTAGWICRIFIKISKLNFFRCLK